MKDIDILLEDLKSHLKSNNKSNNTFITYQKAIIEFSNFMDGGYKDIHAEEFKDIKEFKQVELIHIERYKEYCSDRGNSARTINNKLSAISKFFNNMVVKKKVLYNPVVGVERPLIKTGKPTDSLNHKEVAKLMDAVKTYRTYKTRKHHTIRDYAILHTFLSLGLRVNELSSLKLSDIDFHRKLIWFEGKGGSYEFLPMPKALMESLQIYLAYRDKLNPKAKYKDILFISDKCTRYSIQALNTKVKLYADEAKITKNIHTHSLRHTFAVNTYSVTKDLLGLQAAMRHSSPKTTTIYTGQDDERVRAVVDANTYGDLVW